MLNIINIIVVLLTICAVIKGINEMKGIRKYKEDIKTYKEYIKGEELEGVGAVLKTLNEQSEKLIKGQRVLLILLLLGVIFSFSGVLIAINLGEGYTLLFVSSIVLMLLNLVNTEYRFY